MACAGRAAALFLAAVMAGCAPGAGTRVEGAPAPQARRAVLVSWDGAKPTALKALLAEGRLPVLARLKRRGAWTFSARTVVPSLTLPSHTSMMTGVGPSRHGISWNSYKPERGAVGVQTIFEVAKAAGLRSVLVAGKEKFKHLVKPGAPDRFEWVEDSARAAALTAVRLLAEEHPDLVVLHLRPADDAGHDFGWGDTATGAPPSPQYLEALAECDAATGVLVEALRRDRRWEETLVIVTADHGGHGDTHGSLSDDDMLIPWVAAGGQVAVRGEVRGPVNQVDTPATLLEALGLPVPASWEGRPVPVFSPERVRRAA